MAPLPLPVYQAMPSRSTMTPCGCAPLGSSHSRNCCVPGSKRAMRLPRMTAMKMLPSGAGAGSRANFGVGTGHSRTSPVMVASAPGACRSWNHRRGALSAAAPAGAANFGAVSASSSSCLGYCRVRQAKRVRVLACPAATATSKSEAGHDYAPTTTCRRRLPAGSSGPIDHSPTICPSTGASCRWLTWLRRRSGMCRFFATGLSVPSASAMAAAYSLAHGERTFQRADLDDPAVALADGLRDDVRRLEHDLVAASLLEEAELGPRRSRRRPRGPPQAASAASRAAVKNVLVLRVMWRTPWQ